MPNAPKTPTRTIRVSEELWAAAKEKAAIEERTLTDVLSLDLAFIFRLFRRSDEALVI